jgi:TorA maturation chaperone TorD
MGDCALHVKHILEAFDLEIPAEYETTPDHLTILLELYAFLIGQELHTQAKQFKNDHLDWLEELADQLCKIPGSQFYQYTIALLSKVLGQEQPEIN